MTRALLGVLLAALVLPLASAGSEAEPNGTDPRDQPAPERDVLAFWIEERPEGLRWTVKLVGMSSVPRSHVYYLGFDVDGRRHSMGVGFDDRGRVRSSVDTPSGWFNRVDDSLIGIDIQRGSPAYVSATLPWTRLNDVKDGARLTNLNSGISYNPGSGGWVAPADEALATSAYVIGRGPAQGGFADFLAQPGVAPLLIVTSTGAGAYGGYKLYRMLRASGSDA